MGTTRVNKGKKIMAKAAAFVAVSAIEIIQAIGVLAIGIGTIVFKALGVLMAAAAALLFVLAGLSCGNTLAVFLTAAILFWMPEFCGLLLAGLTVIQGKITETFMR